MIRHHLSSRTLGSLGFCLSMWVLLPQTQAQPSPLTGLSEANAPEPSPELAELERKAAELRARLAEWQAKSLEFLQAGTESEARAG